MKTTLVTATLILAGAALTASPAHVVNSHGQTLPETRERQAVKIARAEPACCFTKALVTQLPSKGVRVQLKQACVPGCDKPCLATTR